MSLTAYDRLVLADRPVLYLPLDDGAGTTAKALAGSAGTYSGGPTLGVDGPVPVGSSAVDLDGSNDYVVAAGPETDFSSKITAEVWFKIAAWPSSNYQVLVAKDDSSTGSHRPWIVSLNTDGTISAYANNNTGPVKNTTATMPLDEWIHFVWTVDGADGAHYINGALDNSYSDGGTLNADTDDVYIGRHGTNATNFLDGSVAAAAVYDYALTASDVARHYQATPVLPRTAVPHNRRL